MIKQPLTRRILTILVLVPVLLLLIYRFHPYYFAGFLLLLTGLAAYEWGQLAGLLRPVQLFAYTLILLLAAFGILFMPVTLLGWLCGAAIFWWLWLAFNLYRYQYQNYAYQSVRLIQLLTGLLVLLPSVAVLYQLRLLNQNMLLYALMLIWSADIGAYVVGKLYGQRRLAARISPGKTWEGTLGGMGFVLIFALIVARGSDLTLPQTAIWTAASLFVAALSIIGDLYESLLKRLANVKDSGNLLPGHGGVLDRIDSLTIAMPLYWLLFHTGILPL